MNHGWAKDARLKGWRCLTLAIVLLTMPAMVTVADASESPVCPAPPGMAGMRPGPATEATPVEVGLYVIDIGSIDDVAQSFTVDLFLRLRWHDPRLAVDAKGRSLTGCRYGLTEVWDPSIVFGNRRRLEPQFDEVVEVGAEGSVTYIQRYLGELAAPLDLRDFPADTQDLVVELVALGHGPEEVTLMTAEKVTGRSEEFTIADWSIRHGQVDLTPLRVNTSSRELARFRYMMSAERHTGFYFWKVLFPLSLIIFMSWTVFWIDPEQTNPQFGISASAILTLIAFQFSLGYFLPRVSYLTRLDRFLVGATVLVFGALAEATLTAVLVRQGKIDAARRIDRWSRAVFLVLFVLVALVAAT